MSKPQTRPAAAAAAAAAWNSISWIARPVRRRNSQMTWPFLAILNNNILPTFPPSDIGMDALTGSDQ